MTYPQRKAPDGWQLVREWFAKHDAYHKASDAYNARLTFVGERRAIHDWESNAHPEYRILSDAQRAAIAAAETLYQALSASPSLPTAQEEWWNIKSAPKPDKTDFRWMAIHKRFGLCIVKWGSLPDGLLYVWPQRSFTAEERDDGFGGSGEGFHIWAKSFNRKAPRHFEDEFTYWRYLPSLPRVAEPKGGSRDRKTRS